MTLYPRTRWTLYPRIRWTPYPCITLAPLSYITGAFHTPLTLVHPVLCTVALPLSPRGMVDNETNRIVAFDEHSLAVSLTGQVEVKGRVTHPTPSPLWDL